MLDHHPQVPRPVSPGAEAGRTVRLSTPTWSKLFARRWPRLDEDWQLFVGAHRLRLRLRADGRRASRRQAAGQGAVRRCRWRPIAAGNRRGVSSRRARSYRIRAQRPLSGRGGEPRVWLSEPGGVTIRYYHGQPLGILLGVVYSGDAQANATNDWAAPQPLGTGGVIKPDRTRHALSARQRCAGQPGRQRGIGSTSRSPPRRSGICLTALATAVHVRQMPDLRGRPIDDPRTTADNGGLSAFFPRQPSRVP